MRTVNLTPSLHPPQTTLANTAAKPVDNGRATIRLWRLGVFYIRLGSDSLNPKILKHVYKRDYRFFKQHLILKVRVVFGFILDDIKTPSNMSVYPRVYGGSISYTKSEDSKIGDILTVSKANRDALKFPAWAPAWDPKDDHKFEHLKPFRHIDRGLFGDPTFKSLLEEKNVSFKKVTPKLGLEVDGIQLSTLSNKQKDDLALLVEQVGVVAFRNQDFKLQDFDFIKDWARYYGPLDIHANSGAPINHPEFHLVFKRGDPSQHLKAFEHRLNNIYWHSDVTYEPQPPGITIFGMLQTGPGGDTQFLDSFEIYDRLSPLMKKKLEGLKVVHTSREQAANTTSEGGVERKEPIDSIHPLVRYHPVLKRKSLYINNLFSKRILGLKTEESENLMAFLNKHSSSCLDAHVRFQWDENTVVLWDNRRVLHTATADWNTTDIRHAFRVTTMAERPVETEEEYENWSPEQEEENIKLTEHYLSLSPAEYYKETSLS